MNVSRREGFTFVEVMAATVLLVVAILGAMAIIVPISRQREQIEIESFVLGQARSLLEEIKGLPPENVELAYDGKTYPLDAADGRYSSSNPVLSVTVDSTNPKLVVVVITGTWSSVGGSRQMELRTEIYSPKGQS